MKKLNKTNINKQVLAKILKACRLAQKHHNTHNVYVTNCKGENFLRVKRVKVGDRVMFEVLDKANQNISIMLANRVHELGLYTVNNFITRRIASPMEIYRNKPFCQLNY